MEENKVPGVQNETNHLEIVIVGGNFAGIQVAHAILRSMLPSTQEKIQRRMGRGRPTDAFTYNVTLCAPNTSFFFKVATPRALSNPEQASDDKIFRDIRKEFEQYKGYFTFMQGKAVGIDTKTRNITVERPFGDDAGIKETTEVPYDILVIATGTRSVSPLWTLHDSHTNSLDAIHKMRDTLAARPTGSVLIAGGGPVGVETAGEIKVAYPGTEVTLITASERILANLKPEISARAAAQLKKLGVTVKRSTVLKDPTLPDMTIPGRAELTVGPSLEFDIFINATGARTMNTEWLPASWLDDERRVTTRDKYFRVWRDWAQNIYAIGDVVSGVEQTALHLDCMLPVVITSMEIDLWRRFCPQGVADAEHTNLLSRVSQWGKPVMPAQVEYKPFKETMMVPVGPRGGVGVGMGYTMPSFVVKKVKGNDFMMKLIEPMVSGSKFKKYEA